MIAINEAADVLRHGWYDAAATLAPDLPEVAELLQARLEIAITSQSLDERHLLDTIEEVEALSSRAGSPASDALALRLRRTVYEYLLALDAVVPGSATTAPFSAPQAIDADTAAPVQPVADAETRAPEAAAAGLAEAEDTASEVDDSLETVATTAVAVDIEPPSDAADDADDEAVGDGEAAGDDASTPRRRFALRRRARADDDASLEGDEHRTGDEHPAGDATAADAPAGSDTSDDEAGATFVAPKAGFHILDDALAAPEEGEQHDTPMPMPAFASDSVAATVPSDDDTTAKDEFLAWEPAHAARPSSPLPGTVADAPHALLSPTTSTAPAAEPSSDVEAAEDDDDDAQRGWRVRPTGEARQGRGAAGTQAYADADDDPFDGNAQLTETRRRIEDRLRHKRCDEAAALLQEIALAPGGRAIADLAMNAGDRCRALGKSNAALNCYLAASRSDPVYELPLSRLADVCIDDKDTDLAVSYLERVARIYRYRGDDKGALRVYRRIATIAPYREDILTLLMAAQGTGRIEA